MDEFDYDAIRRELDRAVRLSCPRSMASQADDVAQEVLVRLLERHRRGEVAAARQASYWRRAAYNAVIDELRRRRRRREESLDEAPSSNDMRASRHHDPERRVASAELARAIDECIAGLADGRQLPVFLHLQGHTTPEAAGILGWAVKRAGSAIFRGVRDLRACLEGKGWGP